jgi:hypothetical protein
MGHGPMAEGRRSRCAGATDSAAPRDGAAHRLVAAQKRDGRFARVTAVGYNEHMLRTNGGAVGTSTY